VLPGSVDIEPHLEIVHIRYFIRRHKPRPGRPECVASLAFVPGAGPFELELALGDIVDDTESRDMVHRVRRVDLDPGLSDHHAQLDLPIRPDGVSRDLNGIVRTAYG
jgi:hypothetical protein